jgi:hypothetical protein
LFQIETRPNNNRTRLIAGALALSGFLVVSSGLAAPLLPRKPSAINRAVLVLVKPSKFFGNNQEPSLSPELIDSYNKVKAREKPFDVQTVIPTSLAPTDNSNAVFSKIADQSISSFFNSAQVRATPFGKTATTVEQKMKQDLVVQSGETQHKFTFQVQAFQALAKIDYTGFTNARLKYEGHSAAIGLEVFEKITKDKELVLEQLNKPDDRVSSVNVRWNF